MLLSTGQEIGPYRILSALGSGGMGEVYRAHDSRLDRIVALKVLPADVAADEERMRRFEQEAKAASKLSHPNVAHIYEIGNTDGIRFIAMEYIEGTTLDARIKKGPLEVDEIIDIGMQLSDALNEAHRKGIIHRDIKPANIMIKEKDQIKMLDFGLAKIIRPAADADSSEMSTMAKTQPGALFGTVPYMSPEQALGRNIDHRSDIFSLGSVLYEMLTGRSPFSGGSAGETLDRILHAQPEAISRFNYNAPAELERIIRKALEKDPESRYQSSGELHVDLKNLRRDTQTGRISGPQPVKARHVSSRQIQFALAAFVLMIVALTAGVFWLSHRNPTIHSIAIMPFFNVGGNPETEYLGDGITESTINALSQLPQLKVMAPGTVFTYKGKNIDPRKVGRELSVDAVVTGKVQQRGDTLIIEASLANVKDGSQIWGDHYERRISDLVNIQSEISGHIGERLKLQLTGKQQKQLEKRYTQNAEAYQLYLKGRYFWNKRSDEGFKKAIDYFQKAIEKDPAYALAYSGLADSYIFDDFQKAKAAALKAAEIDDTIAEVHTSLAPIRSIEWDWAGEEAEYKKAIELNPNYATAHQWYSDALANFGKLEEALAEARRAQELDPLSPIMNVQVGTILALLRRYDEGIEQMKKALEMDSNFFPGLSHLAVIYLMKGMYKEWMDINQKLIPMIPVSAERRELIFERLAALRQSYAASGPKGFWQKRLQIAMTPGNPRPDLPLIYAQLGNKDEAFRLLKKGIEERDSTFAEDFQTGFLKSHPLWDPLRSDPRFKEMIRLTGLPD